MELECPYCKITWHGEESQYCPKCGKLSAVYDLKDYISKMQIVWVIVSGFLSYLALYYLFDIMHISNLPFSNELYLGIAASLFMCYRLFWFWVRSKNESLNNYFPYWKEFLIIMCFVIGILAIVLKVVVDYIAVAKAIDYGFLGVFTLHYFVGFILGSLLWFYYAHHANIGRQIHNKLYNSVMSPLSK